MATIFLVDQDRKSVEQITKILEAQKHEVELCKDGATALEQAREQAPDLIISEIKLHGASGFDILEDLKEDQKLFTIPLVFVTAQDDRDSQRKAMNMGANDFLAKPVQETDLINTVDAQLKLKEKFNKLIESKLADNKLSFDAAAGSSPAQLGGKPDVLIVDDNKINIRLCERFLSDQKIPFRTARNGYEAIGAMLKKPPHVILLDLNMPVIDGTDLLRIIKKNAWWRPVYVIILSSVGSEETIVKLFQMGANDYILKPFKADVFRDKLLKVQSVKRYLDKQKSETAA